MNFVTNLLLAAGYIIQVSLGSWHSPDYLASESLAAVLSHGFNGVVLSWNIMEAPLRNLESLKK